MGDWISIKKELPAYGSPVLLKINDAIQCMTWILNGGDNEPEWFELCGSPVDDNTRMELSFEVDFDRDIQWLSVYEL